jgi:hypothetical protein
MVIMDFLPEAENIKFNREGIREMIGRIYLINKQKKLLNILAIFKNYNFKNTFMQIIEHLA